MVKGRIEHIFMEIKVSKIWIVVNFDILSIEN